MLGGKDYCSLDMVFSSSWHFCRWALKCHKHPSRKLCIHCTEVCYTLNLVSGKLFDTKDEFRASNSEISHLKEIVVNMFAEHSSTRLFTLKFHLFESIFGRSPWLWPPLRLKASPVERYIMCAFRNHILMHLDT